MKKTRPQTSRKREPKLDEYSFSNDKSWQERLCPRVEKKLEEVPENKDLYECLLSIDGVEVVLVHHEPDLNAILDRGEVFDPDRQGMYFVQGEQSNCHGNMARLYETMEEVDIATGYALSTDGLWRQHSFGIDQQNGQIVETTRERLLYFGFILNSKEATAFCDANL